jgi:hypothetical protein
LRLAYHSRVKQTVRPTHVSTSPRLVVRRPLLEQVRRLVPLGSMVPERATSAEGIAAGAASLQGFRPFAGWRHRFRISPSHDALALLAFALLGAFPFPCPESRWLSHNALASSAVNPAVSRPASPPTSTAALDSYLSGTSGKVPFWVLLPVLQSFKEQGNWLCLFRGCRPLEVSVLVSTVAG